jgi:hypothetical protein
MNQDIQILVTALRFSTTIINTQAADLGESITLLLNRTVAIVAAAQEIQRRAIEQSEEVQRDWASPVEVAGMKARIAALESAAAWVPVAQRLPDEGVNVIIRIEDGSGGPTYERMAHIRRHTSGAYDWMEPNRQYVWGGKVIEWFAIPGGTK